MLCPVIVFAFLAKFFIVILIAFVNIGLAVLFFLIFVVLALV